MTDRRTLKQSLARMGFRGGVVVVGILSLLPLADWIPGEPGTSLTPPHWPLYLLWITGLLGAGLLSWVAVKLLPGKKGEVPTRPDPDSGLLSGRWAPIILLIVLPAVLYSVIAREVFDGRPLYIDAMTQAFQGQIFSQGHLSAPAPEHSRFFSSLLIVESEGRTFSQFPPGWAAFLALGFLLGVPWILAPLCGALATWGVFLLVRDAGHSGKTALFGAALFGLSPWIVFNSASWMNHVPTVCFIVLGSVALARGIQRPQSWIYSGLGGAFLGLATLIRPVEGVAFGLPATLWMVFRVFRNRTAWKGLLAFAIGGALTIGLLLGYNWLQHGNPMVFGFAVQWGEGHGLGFHEPPWGPPHTFIRGLQLLNGYLLAAQILFFDAPAPSLLPALVALFFVRRLDALDRYLLAGSALILLAYLSFWGVGAHLGPRYLLPLAPVIAIWTARFGGVLVERFGRRNLLRWAHGFVVLLVVSGWLFGTPLRRFVYSQSYPLRRVDIGALSVPQAQNALVFVPSPWSNQVQSRMRDLGLPRREARWFHDRIGLCRLDLALSEFDRHNITDPRDVARHLLPLTADSTLMVVDPFSGEPGDPYAGLDPGDEEAITFCRLRQSVEAEKGGYLMLPFFALLGPTWTGEGPILARDLHEENPRLLSAFPDRDAYYLRPVRGLGTVRRFTLTPLRPDSTQAFWNALDSLQLEASRALGLDFSGR